jgi:hypothetical protein
MRAYFAPLFMTLMITAAKNAERVLPRHHHTTTRLATDDTASFNGAIASHRESHLIKSDAKNITLAPSATHTITPNRFDLLRDIARLGKKIHSFKVQLRKSLLASNITCTDITKEKTGKCQVLAALSEMERDAKIIQKNSKKFPKYVLRFSRDMMKATLLLRKTQMIRNPIARRIKMDSIMRKMQNAIKRMARVGKEKASKTLWRLHSKPHAP